jgi:hypothetical protein
VTAWDEKGLSYTAPKLPPGQLMPWRTLAPAQVVELAKAAAKPAPLDLGLLAYAVGAYGEVAELLNPEKYAEPTEKALAEDAFARARVEGQEEFAEQALKNAKLAQEKQDKAAAAQALARLSTGGALADTQFAKSHASEITSLLDWASQTGTSTAGGTGTSPTATTTTTPVTPAGTAKTDAGEPNGITPELTAELKKLGWETATGNWAQEGTQKGVFHTKDGKLTLAATDAVAQTGFQVQKGARVALWVRHQPPNDPLGIGQGIMRGFGRDAGPGYGMSCTTQAASLYAPLTLGGWGFRRGDAEKNLNEARIPSKQNVEWPLTEGPHRITVTVRGEVLELDLDGARKQIFKNLRDQGTVVLEVEGSAVLSMPQVKKL